jgi:ABC-2 type transport system ATP-binding protein
LLHDPVILFLDEPTIGLDVVAKERMRSFIREINEERGVTVILTTHDMTDIEKLCRRMILIDHGQVMYDGELATIKERFGKERFGKERILIIDLEEEAGDFSVSGAEVIKQEGNRKWLQFNRDVMSASQLIKRISEAYEIKDLSIQDPEIEVMIRNIYEGGIDLISVEKIRA